ncbi:MAG: branched-chain amino acid ABC transporter permease [Chloroflexota bacterium]
MANRVLSTDPKATRKGRIAAGLVLIPLGLLFLVVLAFILPPAELITLQKVLVLALFAVATNLLIGYGGLVSFGQGVFFGLGAYIIALNWRHFGAPFWVALGIAPVLGGVLALAIGAVALRTRRLYFALLTLAFSQLFFTVAEKWYDFTGGDNGIFGPMLPPVLMDPVAAYFFILAVVVLSLFILWKVTASPFGLALRAIRENPNRAEVLGINVYTHQLAAFGIAGFFGAVAGVLFVVHDQAAYPQLLSWVKSGEPVLSAVIGGMYVFLGPALGAFIFQYGHDFVIRLTTRWQLVLGLVLLLIVLFAPDGLAGILYRVGKRLGGR